MHSSEDECMHSKREKGKEKKRLLPPESIFYKYTSSDFSVHVFREKKNNKTTRILKPVIQSHGVQILRDNKNNWSICFTNINLGKLQLSIHFFQFVRQRSTGVEIPPCPESRSRYKLQIQELATSPSISVSVIRSVTTGQIHHICWQSPPDPFTAFC